MIDQIQSSWLLIAPLLALVAAVWAACHVLLNKRDPRSALLWIGLIWLTPLLGPVLYYVFGINRIRRRARTLRAEVSPIHTDVGSSVVSRDELTDILPVEHRHLRELERLIDRVAVRPLLAGNQVSPLLNGDQAYPAMLEAIDGATDSITLCSYIFDAGDVGRQFADALGRAAARGVLVRVLVDDAGSHYLFPRITRLLTDGGVPARRFHPRFRVVPSSLLNMRSHRKICVVDGRTGFTGGMNIRDGHLLGRSPRGPIQDIHFQMRGPVVHHLQEVFAEDWMFTTGEELSGPLWFPPVESHGSLLARGIADGPDDASDRLRWTLLGALGTARSSVKIVTPYFLPDPSLISALNLAALRGVGVDIFLPERGDHAVVDWAMRASLWQVLTHGCRVWLTPPPFDHSKLVLVDAFWSFLGSANWDPRSLRLNFEFNVECYDLDLATTLDALIERKRADARSLTLADVDGRGTAVRLRDGIARLFSPLL